MDNNDILRRLRYALDLRDQKVLDIFDLASYKTDLKTVSSLLKRDDEEGFLACNDKVLTHFLDGLIVHKRGKQENRAKTPRKKEPLSNNLILKKLRVALKLRDEDIVEYMSLAGLQITNSELNAIFRRPDHKHYKECGDQFLRNFLQGLTKKLR